MMVTDGDCEEHYLLGCDMCGTCTLTFGGMYSLHLLALLFLASFLCDLHSDRDIKAVHFSNMFVNFHQTMQCHITEDGTLHKGMCYISLCI
jgi:hypothetical protein